MSISPPFKKPIWQRNYIRNDLPYRRVMLYIKDNPLKCEEDILYVS